MIKDDCIFCKLANGIIPTNVLYEDDCVTVIFDASPASDGHVLILTKNHFDNIYGLDDATSGHVFNVAVKIANALKDSLGYEGLNIVQNNGEAAGQTVFHFHMHLIPRYKDDTIKVTWKQNDVDGETITKLKETISACLN